MFIGSDVSWYLMLDVKVNRDPYQVKGELLLRLIVVLKKVEQ